MELGQIHIVGDGLQDDICRSFESHLFALHTTSGNNLLMEVNSNGTSRKRQVECLEDEEDNDEEAGSEEQELDEDEEEEEDADKDEPDSEHDGRQEEQHVFLDMPDPQADLMSGRYSHQVMERYEPVGASNGSCSESKRQKLVQQNSYCKIVATNIECNGDNNSTNKSNSDADPNDSLSSNRHNNRLASKASVSSGLSPTGISTQVDYNTDSIPTNSMRQPASISREPPWLNACFRWTGEQAALSIRIPHTNSVPIDEQQTPQAPDLIQRQQEEVTSSPTAPQHRSQQHKEALRRHNADSQTNYISENRCRHDSNAHPGPASLTTNGKQRVRDEATNRKLEFTRTANRESETTRTIGEPPMIGQQAASSADYLTSSTQSYGNTFIGDQHQQEEISMRKAPQTTNSASPSPTFMPNTPISSSSSSSSSSSGSNLSNGYKSSSMFNVKQAYGKQKSNNNNNNDPPLQSNRSQIDHTTLHKNQLSENQITQVQQLQQQQPQVQQQQLQLQNPLQRTQQYPPNHPLGNTKHLCSICGDRASGKHYGVYSCEGCKGFFKRTIRKDIVYVCRASGNCLIDMRQRNRCQCCRYQKCLRQGMKREAVQEEKQRLKLRASVSGSTNCDNQVESTSHLMIANNANDQNSHHHYLLANPLYSFNYGSQAHHKPSSSNSPEFHETQINNSCEGHTINTSSQQQHYSDLQQNQHHNHQIEIPPPSSIMPATNHLSSYHQPISNRLLVMRDYSSYYNTESDYPPARKFSRIDDLTLNWAAQMQIEQLLEWARSVPKFNELLIDDRITLLKAYWNELIISEIAFKSIDALKENQRSLCIGRDLYINKEQAYEIGLSNMFDRIMDELVVKMYDMRVDSNELACLRAIILFNPETQGLKTSQPIEEYRGNVYTALEMYCRKTYDDQLNRFGKLLLRLPALRSIGLKCDYTRRCDNNGNNSQPSNESLPTTPHGGQTSSMGGTSPGVSTSMLGYQVKLLFFDICYESSHINSFLRSNLMH